MRLIPGKTKVSVELFRGILLGDIIVCAVAMAMLILVLLSNLPWKLGICIAVAVVVMMLLIRMDEQPNYVYLLHILSFLGYRRHFGRELKDKLLLEAGEGRLKDVAFEELFGEKPEGEEDRRAAKKKARAKSGGEKSGKNTAKAREKERRREERLLNSPKTPEEVKADSERDRWLTAEEALAYGLVDKVIDKR